MQGAAVDLVDDAVDVKRQAVAQRTHALVEGHQTVGAGRAQGHGAVFTHRHAHRLQGVQHGAVRGGHLPALDFSQAIGKKAQGPLRSNGRIELPHGAGRRIARVHEGLLALLALTFVQGLEVVAAHVDLAAHLQHLRGRAL